MHHNSISEKGGERGLKCIYYKVVGVCRLGVLPELEFEEGSFSVLVSSLFFFVMDHDSLFLYYILLCMIYYSKKILGWIKYCQKLAGCIKNNEA